SPQIHGENPEKDSPLYHKIKDKVNFIKGDVTQKKDWIKALKNIDCIIHLAAETGTGQSMYAVEKYSFINSQGTAILADLLVNHSHQVKKIILGSTRAVYGEGSYLNKENQIIFPNSRDPQLMKKGIFDILNQENQLLTPTPTKESALIKPTSVYAITKYYQEQIIATVCRTSKIDYTILRFQNVYGAGQSLKNPYTGILSIFSTQILSKNKINIFEDGKPVRDFIEVHDVAEAISRCIIAETTNGEIINIGTGNPTTVLKVVKTLEKAFQTQADWKITGDFRMGDIRYNVADISKMKTHLDFKPRISFEEGIEKLVKWAIKQENTTNDYQKSLKIMKEKGLFLKA